MKIYFSGRCAGNYAIPSRPETIIPNSYIMMSYTYARKADKKRFGKLFSQRRKRVIKMNREIPTRKKMKSGITRTPTKKKDQIRYNAANERFMIEEWFEGRYWDPILKGIETNRKKIDAIRVKITKLLKYYRFEEPLFKKLSDRSSLSFTKRENQQLLISIESPYIKKSFPNIYDYISRVYGRPEEQLKEQVSKLKNSKPQLFKM